MWKNARVVINSFWGNKCLTWGVKCCQKSKICYAHCTFLQHLTQVTHLLPRKKLITTAKRKKMQKVGFEPGTFRAADPRRCPLGHSGSRQKWFSCTIYACAIYTCYSIITGYKVTASLLVGTDRMWCWREALVYFRVKDRVTVSLGWELWLR